MKLRYEFKILHTNEYPTDKREKRKTKRQNKNKFLSQLVAKNEKWELMFSSKAGFSFGNISFRKLSLDRTHILASSHEFL
jgi:hypothetical protein